MASREPMASCGYCLGAPAMASPAESHGRCPGHGCECASLGHHPNDNVRQGQARYCSLPVMRCSELDPDTPSRSSARKRANANETTIEAPLGRGTNETENTQMSASPLVNLRALPGSLIAILPDGSEKRSFAGDWGSLKWKVHQWALKNRVGVKPSEYDKVRDALHDAASRTKSTTIKIKDKRGRDIAFTFTPEAGAVSAKKAVAKKAKRPTERVARRTVRKAA